MTEPLPRHSMAVPKAEAWTSLLAGRPDLAAEPLLSGWAQAGYPLVARRPLCSDEAGTVALGLALPPAQGKRRIALAMAGTDILRAGPPPLLAEAAAAAPPQWRASIDALVRLDPLTRVFGSLAWQHLTGLPYITESSDLDLLWDLPLADRQDILLAGIAAIARRAPVKIDGEILGAAGGVNWHELHAAGTSDILVKGPHDVRMMARAAFLAGGQA
jgi:malonate decarboxylase holo-[acyl-carrier-protein] synthase